MTNALERLYCLEQLRVLLASQDGTSLLSGLARVGRLAKALKPAVVNEVTSMKHPIRAQLFAQVICLLSVAQLFC